MFEYIQFVVLKIFVKEAFFCFSIFFMILKMFVIAAEEHPVFDWVLEIYFEINVNVCINKTNQTVMVCYLSSLY